MFCTNCGKPLEAGATACANCGTAVKQVSPQEPDLSKATNNSVNEQEHLTQSPPPPPRHEQGIVDKPNVALNIISLCCFPLLGIILYFVWKDTQPIAAKSALIFSLIGIGVVVLWYVVLFVFGMFSTLSTY